MRLSSPQMLCIASTHKSGSSLVASWLQTCGLVLADGRLMGPGPSNPLGHFEDLDFVDIHLAAIERQHPGADGWKVMDGTTTLTAEERSQVVSLAEVRNRRYPVWGWKDPRTCRFLYEYAQLLPNLTVLALWRPTEAIVASLLRRARSVPDGHGSKVSHSQAVAITEHHTRALSRFVERHPEQCINVQLANILDDDESAFRSIDDALGNRLHYSPIVNVFREDLLHR